MPRRSAIAFRWSQADRFAPGRRSPTPGPALLAFLALLAVSVLGASGADVHASDFALGVRTSECAALARDVPPQPRSLARVGDTAPPPSRGSDFGATVASSAACTGRRGHPASAPRTPALVRWVLYHATTSALP